MLPASVNTELTLAITKQGARHRRGKLRRNIKVQALIKLDANLLPERCMRPFYLPTWTQAKNSWLKLNKHVAESWFLRTNGLRRLRQRRHHRIAGHCYMPR